MDARPKRSRKRTTHGATYEAEQGKQYARTTKKIKASNKPIEANIHETMTRVVVLISSGETKMSMSCLGKQLGINAAQLS